MDDTLQSKAYQTTRTHLANLAQENEQKFAKLLKLQDQFRNAIAEGSQQRPPGISNEETAIDCLLSHYDVEVAKLRENTENVMRLQNLALGMKREVAEEKLIALLSLCRKQLQSTIAVMKEELREESAQWHRALQIKDERLQLHSAISATESQHPQTHLSPSRTEELRDFEAENKQLMNQLTSFSDKYFPHFKASDQGVKMNSRKGFARTKGSSSHQPLSQVPSQKHLSLSKLLKILVEKSTSPSVNDRYVTVASLKVWQPHVELLLRCGVAEQNPRDGHDIRLVNFNT